MQQTGFHLEHCRPSCPKAARNCREWMTSRAINLIP